MDGKKGEKKCRNNFYIHSLLRCKIFTKKEMLRNKIYRFSILQNVRIKYTFEKLSTITFILTTSSRNLTKFQYHF